MDRLAIRLAIAASMLLLAGGPARADIAVVGVDAKAENVNGVNSVPKNAPSGSSRSLS